MKLSNLMKDLKIDYYEYTPKTNTLTIFEPIPVKYLATIRIALPGIKIVIK